VIFNFVSSIKRKQNQNIIMSFDGILKCLNIFEKVTNFYPIPINLKSRNKIDKRNSVIPKLAPFFVLSSICFVLPLTAAFILGVEFYTSSSSEFTPITVVLLSFGINTGLLQNIINISLFKYAFEFNEVLTESFFMLFDYAKGTIYKYINLFYY